MTKIAPHQAAPMRALPTQSRGHRGTPAAADVVTLAQLPPADPRRAALRDRVVEAHLPLVKYLAGRYRHHGEPIEDVAQVATIGLIKAVDRFDPDRGVELASYATPFILGEIRRHFRDRASAVRVPRRLSEVHAAMTTARAELTQVLGRSPTVAELGRRLDQDEETILDALEVGRARIVEPLATTDDAPESGAQGSGQRGAEDEALARVVDRETLRPLLARLPAREKQILAMRFLRDMSQRQIADELGISQMHVSRLLDRTFRELSSKLTVG